MRRALALVALALCLAAPSVWAKGKEEPPPDPELLEITGLEWLEESLGRRMDALLLSMATLQKSGVPFKRSPEHYYKEMHGHLRGHPEVYGERLTDILADHVYATEPAARAALDGLRASPAA